MSISEVLMFAEPLSCEMSILMIIRCNVGTYCLSVSPCTVHTRKCSYTHVDRLGIVPTVEIRRVYERSFGTFQEAFSRVRL